MKIFILVNRNEGFLTIAGSKPARLYIGQWTKKPDGLIFRFNEKGLVRAMSALTSAAGELWLGEAEGKKVRLLCKIGVQRIYGYAVVIKHNGKLVNRYLPHDEAWYSDAFRWTLEPKTFPPAFQPVFTSREAAEEECRRRGGEVREVIALGVLTEYPLNWAPRSRFIREMMPLRCPCAVNAALVALRRQEEEEVVFSD